MNLFNKIFGVFKKYQWKFSGDSKEYAEWFEEKVMPLLHKRDALDYAMHINRIDGIPPTEAQTARYERLKAEIKNLMDNKQIFP